MSARRIRIAFFTLLASAGLGFGTGASAVTTTVTCTGPSTACTNNLNQIMESAANDDVILIGPGTYPVQQSTLGPVTANYFVIRKNITVQSTAGAATTILKATGLDPYAFRFFPHSAGATSPNGAVLDGFTIQGAPGGVALAFVETTTPAFNNITLRNLIVQPNAAAATPVQGISLTGASNSKVDSNTIVCTGVSAICPYQNGIFDLNGTANIITSNTVQGTSTQHAIALQGVNGDVVAGNTITGSSFHGIIALNTSNSRIERNSISGHRHDGITVTDNSGAVSTSNFIGHNKVVSTSWQNHVPQGTGLWLNAGSDGNMAFGNDLSGEPENGMSVWASSYNHVLANRIHNNYQGGILVWQNQTSTGVGASTSNNLIRSNFIYNNPTNGMVNLRDTVNPDVAFNSFWGGNFAGDTVNPTTDPNNAAFTASPGGIVNNTPYAITNAQIYGNMGSNMTNNIALDKNTASATIFRNRFFGMGGYPQTGVMDNYAITPAVVNWDGGAVTGGNYWDNFAVAGNPSSGGTPYTDIYCPGASGCPYKDNYPFASETLGQGYSVSVTQPRAGATIGAGTIKTVAWSSQACAKVDIDLMNGGTPVSALAANYPDTGYYVWNVASGLAAGTYSVRVSCKNFAGTAVGVTGTSGTFTVAASGLALLSPGPMYALQPGAATVAIARSGAATGAVNVFISVNGAAETSLGTIPAGSNTLSVTLPTTSSNTAAIRITDGTRQDGSDGYFSIVQTTGAGLTTALGSSITPGSRVKLEWISYPGSKYVDIDVFNGTTYVPVAQKVADFGRYEWLVPMTLNGSGRNLRLTYRATPGGAALSTATSGTFSIAPSTDLAVSQVSNMNPASSGKDVIFTVTVTNVGSIGATNVVLNNPIPGGSSYVWSSLFCTVSGSVTCNVGSLAPGGTYSYQVVLRPAAAGTITNTASVTLTEADSNPSNNTSSLTVPVVASPAAVAVLRYRLYSPVSLEHHFTTDLNEYTVLGASGAWVQEGTVGKVLNNPGSFNGVTAIPYYRLYNTTTRWHHWTTDSNEYYTLGTFPGWNQEGVDGYILPTITAGAMQLYRLVYPNGTGLHHWTVDSNEYNTLIGTYGWVGEGGAGFVIQ